jgi:D-alanine transaminase
LAANFFVALSLRSSRTFYVRSGTRDCRASNFLPLFVLLFEHAFKERSGGKRMILLNDRFTERNEVIINIEDRGYQFGDGVYEVIRVYGGVCFSMNAHMQRLKRSAAEIEMALPYPLEEIEQKLLQLVETNGLENGHIYMQITRGVAPRTHHFPDQSSAVLVAYTKETERPMEKINHGISTILTEDIRWLRCDIKSLNLLGNVLAKQKAKKYGCDEAILHRGNTVTEGSSTNVYIVNGNEIHTHPANNLILNGITRIEVLRLAKENGVQVVEEAFSVKELLNADEVFVTSTTMEITPVTRIDQTAVGSGQPGSVTRKIQKGFQQLCSLNPLF